MGKLPRGICIKGGSTYRRFRIHGSGGRWRDQYVKLPSPEDPRFLSELARVNGRVPTRGTVEQWAAAKQRDSEALPIGPLVYFLQSVPGYVKIGFTADLRRRVRELNHASPISIRLLACALGGDLALERAYHRRFKQWHSRGEWFALADQIEIEIERLQALSQLA